MKHDFYITDIKRVISVNEKKYITKKADYYGSIKSNEIIYRPHGSSTVKVDDTVINTSAGSVYIIPKGEYKSYTVNFSEPDLFIDIFFETDKPICDKPILLKTEDNKNLDTLFRKIYSKWVKKDSGYEFECMSLLYKILAETERNNYISSKKFSIIHPAIKYIEENYKKEKISCIYLAKICGINYSYLERLFKEKYNTSPKKYIIKLKINFACNMLESNAYSIREIAEELGFSDLYFFSRQFKTYTGLSPTEYRKKHIL